MPERNERMLPVPVIASIALHAAIAVPVIFDLDLFGSSLEEPVIAFAVGMVPLSELTAAPQVGEITPPRPLDPLELPAGDEAAEVETVDPEAPPEEAAATPSPESASEPPPAEELPAETPPPPEVATADPPPLLTEAPDLPPPSAEELQTAPLPDLPDPELQEAPNAPAPDAREVAALDAPTLPSEPQPEDRPADPALPAPPLPPERTQARVRSEPEPAEDEEDVEEPPVEAVTPPEPEEVPPETELAVLEPPPLPSFTPERERAPEPPTPETPVVDNTAEPPEQTSAVDSLLASMEETTAATSAQGTGTDAGSGGRSGEGTAQSGARLAGDRLTLSEEEALRAQLKQCWNIPAGAMDAENLQVEIDVVMNPDRTVASAEVVNSGPPGDTYFQAAADAARRALFICSPLALPPDKYEQWAQITFIFDPRDMF
jgi:hypothetical protein